MLLNGSRPGNRLQVSTFLSSAKKVRYVLCGDVPDAPGVTQVSADLRETRVLCRSLPHVLNSCAENL